MQPTHRRPAPQRPSAAVGLCRLLGGCAPSSVCSCCAIWSSCLLRDLSSSFVIRAETTTGWAGPAGSPALRRAEASLQSGEPGAIPPGASAVHPVSTREETTGMSLKLRPQDTARRVLPRAAAVALALGGLTSSIVVADSAGATSRAKGLVISTTTNPKYGTILVSGTTVYTLKTASKSLVWRQVPEGLASGAVAEGREAGQGWERRGCHEARHRQAPGRRPPGDLCRQGPLLVLRGQPAQPGEG